MQLCDMVVSAECIAASDAATCVRQDMDAEYFERFPQQPAGLPTAAKAGIGVGAGVAAAAILAAVAALLMRCKRMQAQEDMLPVHGRQIASLLMRSKRMQEQKDLLPVHGKQGDADLSDVPGPEPKTYTHVEAKDGQGLKPVVVFGSNGSSLTSSMISTGTCRNSNEESVFGSSNMTPVRSSNLGSTMSGSSLLTMMHKVPEILRGTMSKEQASSISLGEPQDSSHEECCCVRYSP